MTASNFKWRTSESVIGTEIFIATLGASKIDPSDKEKAPCIELKGLGEYLCNLMEMDPHRKGDGFLFTASTEVDENTKIEVTAKVTRK